ncbi:Stress responsive A/B Barrel Domain [Jatrophihabitans endophyticus]|uniref:Stress responsive A/B Barrel Domain n=1 Tax=Jatrophihabitans endophyticus TaxID=1206085 RepID=A0A1M5P4R4_9ACTN|nr:Dabb family protein [Jatrophihabitans endophyticus]SHG96409.1 Stress responsive A/B Barrel Domain [Jatrophihabitans endophyticus]
MIRNVVLGRVRDDLDDAGRQALDEGLAGIGGLVLPGLIATRLGYDLALREGGWSFAITNDWADAEAYRAYDADAEHNRYRAAVVAACEQVARVQFEI